MESLDLKKLTAEELAELEQRDRDNAPAAVAPPSAAATALAALVPDVPAWPTSEDTPPPKPVKAAAPGVAQPGARRRPCLLRGIERSQLYLS